MHGALLGYGAATHSPARDEVAHLAAGLSHWEFRRFDLYRVNPPLVRTIAAAPTYFSTAQRDWSNYVAGHYDRPEFLVGRDFISGNGKQAYQYFLLGRLACIPFSLLSCWLCYRWATDLFGASSGLIAATLWCFLPEAITNGQLITPDAAATALGLAFWYAFWRYLRTPSWPASFGVGVLLGLAMLTKLTWLLAGPTAVMWWMVSSCFQRRERAELLRQVLQLTVAVALSVYVINLGYLFEGTGTRLGEYSFISSALSGGRATERLPGNRFGDSWLSVVPVPLPTNYVRGIDVQKHEFDRDYDSYLRGQWQKQGWWYYYLYGLLIKTPAGCLAIFLVAVLWKRPWEGSGCGLDHLTLLLPGCYILGLVSSQTGFNHHLRYVLPGLPYFVIFATRVFSAKFVTRRPSRRFAAKPLLATMVCWSIASSLSIYPHSHSFFNEFIGGPHAGSKHLLNSNVDWGQDVLLMRRWLGKHPDITTLSYVPYCNFDFRAVDPDAAWQLLTSPPNAWKPGWYAISVNQLNRPDRRYEVFSIFTPADFVGYSTRVYRLDEYDVHLARHFDEDFR